jgi:hypothetical protein
MGVNQDENKMRMRNCNENTDVGSSDEHVWMHRTRRVIRFWRIRTWMAFQGHQNLDGI